MKLKIMPGRYVVAVSGGVDSMVLLDMLVQLPGLELVVAHFDHGIRPDSAVDGQLVQSRAEQYGLPYIYGEGRLGPGASEAAAREARYAFLRQAQAEQGANGIIMAHHQGDALETALLNLLRGTGRRGLSSLRSVNGIVRPLLDVPKEELLRYATDHAVPWREDSTNTDEIYLRNYIRRQIVPKLSTGQRRELLERIYTAARLNDEIDTILDGYTQGLQLARTWFIMLPHAVACEVMASWLRRHTIAFDRYLVDRLVVFAKTAVPGKRASVDARYQLEANKQYIILLANQ